MHNDTYIVGIGASAGGHQAIREFFRCIPANFPGAIVVVTHLLRNYKSALAPIISRYTKLKVQKLDGITRPQAGHVYVLPEDVFVIINNGLLYLKPRPENNINKAIDIFLESLAVDQKEKAIGVILSGMGNDGTRGALKLYEQGGDVLVQEPASASFDSMPVSVIAKDHPDYILPPKKLGEKLVSIVQNRLNPRPMQITNTSQRTAQ